MTKMLIERSVVEQALEALEGGADSWQLVGPAIDTLRAALAEPVEPDLSRCPKCNGPADNGHDREVPPNPYVCTKCMAEPVAWMRVIDEAMVTHHLGVADPADDYETAKRKMNTLLCMAQDTGTYFAKQAEPVQESATLPGPGLVMCPACCAQFDPALNSVQPVQEPVAQRGAMFRTHPAVELQRSVESAVRPACGVDPAAKAEPVQESE